MEKQFFKMKIMKSCITSFFLLTFCVFYGQNTQFKNERYEVINDFFSSRKGDVELDRDFFPFLGLSVLIAEIDLIDNLLGHCVDPEKQKTYSYGSLISKEEIFQMQNQLDSYFQLSRIDSKKVSEKIKLVNDRNNSKTAITLPLISNDKAIIYITNKRNEEELILLVKDKGKWNVRCKKYFYLRIDD
jgi:hypothetical protein